MKTETELKTYVIQIPDCSGSFAAFDFEEDDWRSTNDLTKTWQVDELNASDAADNFRETFDIDRTNHVFAILLSEAIEEEAAAVLMILSYSQEAGGVVIKSCSTSATGVLVIPDVVGGLPVTRIESWAFAGCSGLTSVTIPNSVTEIGNYAFRYCIGLTFLNLPRRLTSIGAGVFSGCSGLTSVTIPCGTPCLGDYAFYGCTELLKLSLGPLMFKCGTHNVLNAHGVKSALDLASKSECQLMRFRGVGKKRLNEIKEKLNSFGLKLAEEKPA